MQEQQRQLKQFAPRRVLALCLLVHGANSARVNRHTASGKLLRGGSAAESSPVRRILHRSDCFKRRPISLAAQNNSYNHSSRMFPGAGMSPDNIVPFETVLKDGYYSVACGKDYMYYFGDKFGNNKFDYALGKVSNVSIVLYDEMVRRQDRQPMTHEVCFDFCRTVQDMQFFGLHNGRSCYCMPYSRLMEGDSSMCDAHCEGDSALMCGGITKSMIFEMHSCRDTHKDLQAGIDANMHALEPLSTSIAYLETVLSELQSKAESVQGIFGPAGDPGASDLAQSAKVYAGKLLEAVKSGRRLYDKMMGMNGSATELMPMAMSGKMNFKESEAVEALGESLEEVAREAEEKAENLMKLVYEAHPEFKPGGEGVVLWDMYYPKNHSRCDESLVSSWVDYTVTAHDCQKLATERGHPFYQWAPKGIEDPDRPAKCGTSDKCDKKLVKENTPWAWQTYAADPPEPPKPPKEDVAIDMYYDIMYFVDKSQQGLPTTCGGKVLGVPFIGTFQVCANICQNMFKDCVGFQWFRDDLCFLFSEFDTTIYYTGCHGSKWSAAVDKAPKVYEFNFEPKADTCPGGSLTEQQCTGLRLDETQGLELGIAPVEQEVVDTPKAPPGCNLVEEKSGKMSIMYNSCKDGCKNECDAAGTNCKPLCFAPFKPSKCMVKYSKFDGMTLKPDPSGKCEHCLKKATKAASCAEMPKPK